MPASGMPQAGSKQVKHKDKGQGLGVGVGVGVGVFQKRLQAPRSKSS